MLDEYVPSSAQSQRAQLRSSVSLMVREPWRYSAMKETGLSPPPLSENWLSLRWLLTVEVESFEVVETILEQGQRRH